MEAQEVSQEVRPTIINGTAVFKVSGKTSVSGLAGAITKALEDGHTVEVQSIGAGALNQGTKGIAKARGFIAHKGRDLIVRPGFGSTVIDGEKRTTLVNVVTMQ